MEKKPDIKNEKITDIEKYLKKKRHSKYWLNRIRFQIAHGLSYFLLCHPFRHSNHLRNKLCRWLVPSADGPTLCPSVFGTELLVDPIVGKGLETEIYYFGVYEAGTISVLKKFLHKGDIFVDVGANIGSISCIASHFVGKNGRVYAFEPYPEIYKILKNNIYINKLKNVFTFNVALGTEISSAIIYDNLDINRASASLIRPENAREESGKKVEVTTIDSLIENKQLSIPTLIKIDVEGFELEVLKGAKTLLSSPQAPMLCVECSTYHSQYKGSTHDIYTFIKSINNYSCYKLKHSKEIPSKLVRISEEKDLPRHDNIFCFPNKHPKHRKT